MGSEAAVALAADQAGPDGSVSLPRVERRVDQNALSDPGPGDPVADRDDAPGHVHALCFILAWA